MVDVIFVLSSDETLRLILLLFAMFQKKSEDRAKFCECSKSEITGKL